MCPAYIPDTHEGSTSLSSSATVVYSVPGEPRDVLVRPVNSSTILVEWKPPLDTQRNGIIRAFQIYVQPKKTVREEQRVMTRLRIYVCYNDILS